MNREFEQELTQFKSDIENGSELVPNPEKVINLYFKVAELGGIKDFSIPMFYKLMWIDKRWEYNTISYIFWDEYMLNAMMTDIYLNAIRGEVITTDPKIKAFIMETAKISWHISQKMKQDLNFHYTDTKSLENLEELYQYWRNESIKSPRYLEDIYFGIYRRTTDQLI